MSGIRSSEVHNESESFRLFLYILNDNDEAKLTKPPKSLNQIIDPQAATLTNIEVLAYLTSNPPRRPPNPPLRVGGQWAPSPDLRDHNTVVKEVRSKNKRWTTYIIRSILVLAVVSFDCMYADDGRNSDPQLRCASCASSSSISGVHGIASSRRTRGNDDNNDDDDDDDETTSAPDFDAGVGIDYSLG